MGGCDHLSNITAAAMVLRTGALTPATFFLFAHHDSLAPIFWNVYLSSHLCWKKAMTNATRRAAIWSTILHRGNSHLNFLSSRRLTISHPCSKLLIATSNFVIGSGQFRTASKYGNPQSWHSQEMVLATSMTGIVNRDG